MKDIGEIAFILLILFALPYYPLEILLWFVAFSLWDNRNYIINWRKT